MSFVFLISGSFVGCLYEDNPSPFEKRIQVMVAGTSEWISGAMSTEEVANPLAGFELARETFPITDPAVEEIVEAN